MRNTPRVGFRRYLAHMGKIPKFFEFWIGCVFLGSCFSFLLFLRLAFALLILAFFLAHSRFARFRSFLFCLVDGGYYFIVG